MKREALGLRPRYIFQPAPLVSWLLCAVAALTPPPATAQVSVLTDNYNNSRTNANLRETMLNTLDVEPSQFGKLFSLPVNGAINAQPLYMQGVSIPGKGTHNVVYVVTHHNDVYAFDADAQGNSLWHTNLGPSVPGTDYNVDDLDQIGVLSTPVIDAVTNTLYAVAHTKEDGSHIYRLHALDVTTGAEMFGGPTVIEATVPGTSHFDSHDGQIVFDPSQHLQRPGLLLLNNVVYIGFGSHDDIGIWHGWFLGYNAANIQQQVSALNTSPDGWGASIWQGGRAPAVDEKGNIYWGTGNGSFDGKRNLAESFVKLDTSAGTPVVSDWFAPDNWSNLTDLDNDLGSCGPILMESGLVVGGGKEGVIYVMDRRNMGHTQPGNGQIVQHFQALGYGIFNMAYWERRGGPILYLRGNHDAVKAFRFVNGQFQPTPFSQSGFTAGLPYDGLAISANGSAQYSAILWVTSTLGGDNNGPGTLHALSAMDLSKELWNSDMSAARDSLGTLAKYTAPTVANGKVYVPTFANKLVVYGLLAQKQLIGDVVNSASNLGGAIAPGELVVVYGSGLGPATLATTELDSTGRLTRSIGGTQVLFNGAPAPLVYARADQVAAIVPNAVAGQPTAKIQVQYQNQSSPSFSIPVSDTAPGLFTVDQTGRGQGAILNQDNTLNGRLNAAPRGSIVVLWATGQGPSDPDWAEDELAAEPLPKPTNPVKVTIGGQEGEILYAGAAPGMAGVMQVNVRVPTGIKTGSAIPVVLTIGAASSQPGVTLAVQ
jgi:uncharacterized protein (TIGR03437 family)